MVSNKRAVIWMRGGNSGKRKWEIFFKASAKIESKNISECESDNILEEN